MLEAFTQLTDVLKKRFDQYDKDIDQLKQCVVMLNDLRAKHEEEIVHLRKEIKELQEAAAEKIMLEDKDAHASGTHL